jgi:hypothetical protein
LAHNGQNIEPSGSTSIGGDEPELSPDDESSGSSEKVKEDSSAEGMSGRRQDGKENGGCKMATELPNEEYSDREDSGSDVSWLSILTPMMRGPSIGRKIKKTATLCSGSSGFKGLHTGKHLAVYGLACGRSIERRIQWSLFWGKICR